MLIPKKAETAVQRPYLMVGAGDLTASIWKLPEASSEGHYVFNVFRMNRHAGHVSQKFVPSDVADLVKLAHVLAASLLDDGCLSDAERRELRTLNAKLELLWSSDESESNEFTEVDHAKQTVIS